MKLLKLVPDHTNLDFMRWRNVAVVLSTLATIASIAFTAAATCRSRFSVLRARPITSSINAQVTFDG